MKKLIAIAALACLSLVAGTVSKAKQYTVTFSQTVLAGSQKLAPGDYKLKVEGENATFTDSHRKTYTVPVKVENVTKKAPITAVETKEVGGTATIAIIDLAGADFKLIF